MNAIHKINRNLFDIQEIADENQIDVMFVLIPSRPWLRAARINRIEFAVDNLGVNLLHPNEDSFHDEDYATLPNDHFNNSGHGQFAAWLLNVISREYPNLSQ